MLNICLLIFTLYHWTTCIFIISLENDFFGKPPLPFCEYMAGVGKIYVKSLIMNILGFAGQENIMHFYKKETNFQNILLTNSKL